MRRYPLFMVVLTLLIGLVSCQLLPTDQEEQFEPRMSYDEVREGAFSVGSIPFEYILENTFIKFLSTSGMYGYIYVLDPSKITVEWVLFNADGGVEDHREDVQLSGSVDFDGDGVPDLSIEEDSMDFTRTGDTKSLFSYDFPNGILYVSEDGGRVYKTDPERFDPVVVDGILPTATLVYYRKENLPDLKVDDVIFDVKSYEYLGEMVIRKITEVKDEGDHVLVISTPVGIEDVIPALSFRFKGDLSEAVPLNEDALKMIEISKAEEPLLDYSSSTTLYGGKYATLTAHYGIGMGANFDISTDYDWNSFDMDINASLIMWHDLKLGLVANASYSKDGKTDPFYEPSFAFSVYGIPVVVSFPMYAGYSFEATGTAVATVGYDLSAEIGGTAGIRGELDWGGIDVDYDADAYGNGDADLVGPEYDVRGEMRLRLYVGVDVKVSVAELGYANFINHPYLKPEADGHFEGEPFPDGEIETDIDYGVDFSVELGYDFKAKDGSCDKHLKDWKAGSFGPWTFGFPAPPSDLSGKFINGEGVILSWKDNSSYEDGYEIVREKLVSGSWHEDGAAVLSENATEYTDTTAHPMTTYRYSLHAVSNWPTGYTYRSPSVSVEVEGTPPPKPTDPDVFPSASQASLKPRLSWKCDDGDSLEFDLYLSKNNPPETLLASGIIYISYGRYYYDLENELDGDTTYYWRVVVHNDSGFTTEGDVWSFKTIPDDKRYLFVQAYDKDPYTNPSSFPVSLNGIGVEVDGESSTTPATFLVNTHISHTITAQYYPKINTRVSRQWLFKEWIRPVKSSNPSIDVEISEDTMAAFVAGEFLKLEVNSSGGGTAVVLTEGRNSFYEKNSTVEVRATPYDGYEFVGWYSDGDLVSESAHHEFVIENPVSLEARFEFARVDLSVDSTPIRGVQVRVDGEPHTTPFTLSVVKGEHTLELVETPEDQIGVASNLVFFKQWNMNTILDDNPVIVLVDTDRSISVEVDLWHMIDRTVIPDYSGTIVIDPELYRGYSKHSENIEVMVDPYGNYSFDHYTINGEDYYDDYYSTTVNGPIDIAAYFELP